MKIAIVRGPSLNPWEMQNYLPLAQGHELRLIGTGEKVEKVEKVEQVEKVCLGEIFSFIPGGIKLLYRLFGDPQILLGFEKAISGFDILHTAELTNYYSFQAVRARRKGLVKKVVVTCWENIARAREEYPAQKRIKKAVVRGADHFLAVTKGAKQALLAEGVEEKRITVVGMGVNLKRCKGAEVQRFKVKKGKRILFVGRLEEEKGIWELLEAFRDLRYKKGTEVQRFKGSRAKTPARWKETNKEFRNLRLTMVGKGSQEKLIRDWAVNNGLEKAVQLKGWVEYGKIWQEYRRADIFVLPSKPRRLRISGRPWQEQFGMVLVEAMASGVPIVAAKSGAIPEVVGEAGILVEPGNSHKLAEAIERLIRDESLRKSLRFRGFKRVRKRYDSEKVAGRIERVYKKVLNN